VSNELANPAKLSSVQKYSLTWKYNLCAHLIPHTINISVSKLTQFHRNC